MPVGVNVGDSTQIVTAVASRWARMRFGPNVPSPRSNDSLQLAESTRR
jgi:hypothetical protein